MQDRKSGSVRTLGHTSIASAMLAACWAAPASAQIVYERLSDGPVLPEYASAMTADSRFISSRRPETVEPRIEVDARAFEFEAGLALVSDFRRGGISSSNGKPAIQPWVGVSHKSGLYASLWGSNVANNGGADIELDIALGYAMEFGKLRADLGVIEYIFPGVANSSYLELQAGMALAVGTGEVSAAMAYTPKQGNTGHQDNIYLGVGFEAPVRDTPLTVLGSIGVEDGAFGDRKLDWQLAGKYDLKVFELGLAYIDAARTSGAPHSGATAVVSLEKAW